MSCGIKDSDFDDLPKARETLVLSVTWGRTFLGKLPLVKFSGGGMGRLVGDVE